MKKLFKILFAISFLARSYQNFKDNSREKLFRKYSDEFDEVSPI